MHGFHVNFTKLGYIDSYSRETQLNKQFADVMESVIKLQYFQIALLIEISPSIVLD